MNKNIFALKIFLISLFFYCLNLKSQNIKLKNGIFLTFENFKNNNPIPSEKINFEKKAGIFIIDNIVQNDKFTYVDDSGKIHEYITRNIWGISENGNIYIRRNKEFFKIIYLGQISYFIGKVQTVMNDYTYNNINSPYQRTIVNNEFKQFLLDFETGDILDFNEISLEKLLMKDAPLYNEYKSLSKKKKKQLKFYYIRKFNEKYPLPFEIN